MTENTTPGEEQASSTVQPGDLTAKLQACREQAGLDIEQAADEMHLSVSLLRALEKEDFAHLPEPPYVRGYLRGYAKLTDQDAKELIRTYEALRGADPDEIAHHFAPARPLGRVTQPAISPSTFKFIALAVIVLGLGLLTMIPGVRAWFSNAWSNFSSQTAPPQVVRPAPALDAFTARKDAEEAARQEQQAAVTQTDGATETGTGNTAENAEMTAEQSASATGNEEAQTTETAATDAQTATTEASTATTEPASSDTMAQNTPASTDQVSSSADMADNNTSAVAADTTVSVAGAATTLPAQASTGTDTATVPADSTTNTAMPEGSVVETSPQPIAGDVNVKLEFTEEVWMQVKDDSKKTLFESLNSAGSTKEFKASTPLNFKVGNARGVKIYLNGQPFDQAPHTKGSVARFKVE